MATDWEALAEEYKTNFKDYASLGKYRVKVAKATVTKLDTGSIRVVFEFEETDEHKYPRSSAHWISRKNINWTKWHHMNLLKVLGVEESKAKQAIDNVEKDTMSLDQLVKSYQTMYDRACSKRPEVEIVVREQLDRDGMKVMSDKGYAYTESEFTDPSVYSSNKQKSPESEINSIDDLGVEEVVMNTDEIPF